MSSYYYALALYQWIHKKITTGQLQMYATYGLINQVEYEVIIATPQE